MDLFRVRLNCVDYYQATPTRYDPQLRNDIHATNISKLPKVPVVRVFGSTETGQKVCAHIHGAFPYLYIQYQGILDPDTVGAYIYRLHLAIDRALAVSYRRDQFDDTARYVARITLTKGVPFYGFHVGYKFYLKIYMFNPVVMTRLADLLHQGAILKQSFQPYEAHLQYLLQFMTDYNLYGCEYIDSAKTNFRSPVPEPVGDVNSSHLWHSQSVSPHLITDEPTLPRVSHCSIEVDICVQDITNRRQVNERQLHHDFVERLHPLSPEQKLVFSMAGLWRDEIKRRKRRMNPSDQIDDSPLRPEALITMSNNPRDSQPASWLHEEEFRDSIRHLIREEGGQGNPLDFDSFVSSTPFEDTVNTALQSVADLHPSVLMPALGLSSEEQGQDHQDSFNFPYDSDEDALRELMELERSAAKAKAAKTKQDSTSPEKGKTVRPIALSAKGPSTEDESLLNRSSRIRSSSNKHDTLSRRASKHQTSNQDIQDSFRSSDQDTSGAIPSKIRQATLIPESNKASNFIPPSNQYAFHESPDLADPIDFTDWTPISIPNSQETPTPTPKTGKRPVDFSPTPNIKRRKLSTDDPAESRGNSRYKTAENQPSFPLSGSQGSQGNRSSLSKVTGNSNQTLNFPIVKDVGSSQGKHRPGLLSHPSTGWVPESSQDPGIAHPNLHNDFEVTSSYDDGLSGKGKQDPSSQDKFTAICAALARNNPASAHLVYAVLPPDPTEPLASQEDGPPNVIYQDAYYSKEKDVPARTREYAGREFRLKGNTLPYLPEFDPTGTSPSSYGQTGNAASHSEKGKEVRKESCALRTWDFAKHPPTYEEVEEWEKRKKAGVKQDHPSPQSSDCTPRPFVSQIDGPTPKNKHGYKYSPRIKSSNVDTEGAYMSTMSLEVHVNTRGKLVPNPEEDEVQCIFWSFKSDDPSLGSQDYLQAEHSGVVVLSQDGLLAQRMQKMGMGEVFGEDSELDVFVRMVEIVRTHDPDILTGFEVHASSWGFVIERARFKYDFNLCDQFSRMKCDSHGRFGKENDRWGFNTTSTIRVTGRHMINIWRAMRGELNLLQYTMENITWHLLHRRIPHFPWDVLTTWYSSGNIRTVAKVLRYYQSRVRLDIEILEANELVSRTSEQARVLGVDFFSVFSRGSQFKVESIMFRIAKPENLILISPNRKQVGGQNALECLPLVMEPQSAFYNSPVLVLDFQSLYPSVMIAYNFCYSTFLGRITNWRGMNKMGFTEYRRQQGLLELLKDYINISANGMMFVKPEIRKSLLAKMLAEILETRVMVKSSMKKDKDDKSLHRLLNNRQLALKLLANVTYGYTSASFSGRMPCSEIADSIVQTARETLERAIAYIHSNEKWDAEVVYGDTDSLFVHLKGRTKDEAFDIGNEIATAITNMNPRPIKLKFEKVYHPCVLLAKKRYVGYKYESKDQVEPEFDAKGIETVRRDGTPAEQKIEEKALRMLFETADLSRIKAYFRLQCHKLMRGQVSIQDFCFAKEVRLGTYSDKGPAPAGALISTKRMLADARAEPQYGERVPYVVISGAPGARLVDRSVAPEDLLANPHWRLDAQYYITKNLIPPLDRIFNLVGASVRQWYDEMPKVRHYHSHFFGDAGAAKKATLEFYLRSMHCVVCSRRFKNYQNQTICRRCRGRKEANSSLLTLQTRLRVEEQRYQEVMAVCHDCEAGGGPLEEVQCDSKDCPVFWSRMKQKGKLGKVRACAEPAIKSLLVGIDRRSLQW